MNLQSEFNLKSMAVKPVANALIAGGLAMLMGDVSDIKLPLVGLIPAYTGIGIASGVASLVAEPLKQFVVPLIEHNQYLQKLEGSVLDVALASLSTIGILAVTNGVPFNLKSLGYLASYGVAGCVGSNYIVDHFF